MIVIFVLLFPIFVFLLLATVEYSRLVFTKIKFQESLDRAVFVGASHMTEALNQSAHANRKIHQEFLSLKKRFGEGSRQNITEMKQEIAKTWNLQNQIFESEIAPKINNAYREAYAIASEALKKDFPKADLTPLWQKPLIVGEGRTEEIGSTEIKGIVFDPTGHRNAPKEGFEARLAFIKDIENPARVAATAEIEAPKPLLSFFRWPHLQARAAAQPYGGSLWGYAMEGLDRWLYRTAWIPTP